MACRAEYRTLYSPIPFIVRTTIERIPRRSVERGMLGDLCPVTGAIQLLDVVSGRNLAAPLALDATPQNPEFVPDVDG